VGGVIYNDLKLKFLSPTINLFFFAEDYIIFLENLKSFIDMDPKYDNHSKYSGTVAYPIGHIESIEIHFTHYDSIELAQTKWASRKKRINYDNLFIMGSDRDNCNLSLIKRFDVLPYKNKIFFTSQKSLLKSCLYIDKYKQEQFVGDMILNRDWSDYFDLIQWLNTGKIKRYWFKPLFLKYKKGIVNLLKSV
jgi:uncharacterized protein (DUF1919 family)